MGGLFWRTATQPYIRRSAKSWSRLSRRKEIPESTSCRGFRSDADPLSFALKTPWSDGTRHLLLSPMELLEKLAALVPPPRFHLLRYHGVLAPRARARDRIVPAQPGAEPAAQDASPSAASCGHRLRWATLLARVFSLRPQRMRGLWRSPADRRRPDRSGLDPDLSGGGRAAGDAPAESPASAAVRVRRLTSSAIRSRRREAYGGVCPQRSSGPGLIRIRADRQLNCTASSVEGRANDPPGAADPGGALSALTEQLATLRSVVMPPSMKSSSRSRQTKPQFKASIRMEPSTDETASCGDRHAEAGARSGPAPAEGGRAAFPEHAWRRVEP